MSKEQCQQCLHPDYKGMHTCGLDGQRFIDELKQDQKDFPHIAQDIQVAIDHESLTPEQHDDMHENATDFYEDYCGKYRNGQKEHGGNLWEMGAYQALEGAKEEVLDQWSYLMTIEKILGEIEKMIEKYEHEGEYAYRLSRELKEILNRVKQD